MSMFVNASHRIASMVTIASFAFVSTGCTHWNRVKHVTYEKEVSRNAVGGPRIEETYSSSVRSDSSTVKERERDIRTEDTTTGTTYTSVRRTRCVQDFEISYYREFDADHEVSLLWLDITGASLTGLLGGGVLASSLSESPQNTGGAVTGAIFLAGSLAWLAYGLGKASSPPVPRRFSGEETITLRRKLDVNGCQNLSGGSSTDPDSPEERLRKLDALYKEGVISETEYRRKKRDILKDL